MEPELDGRGDTLAPDIAGFGQRILARVVDGLVLLVPNLLLVATLSGFTEIAAVAILDLGYEIPQLVTWGRTIGKRALGIRVVTIDGRGAPPSWGQAFVRVVVPQVFFFSPSAAIAGLAPIWLLVVYVPVFFDPWRRGLHDRAAGTRVIRDV